MFLLRLNSPHWSCGAWVSHKYQRFYNLNYTDIFLFSSMGQLPLRPSRSPRWCQALPSTTTAAFNRRRFRALQILPAPAFVGQAAGGMEGRQEKGGGGCDYMVSPLPVYLISGKWIPCIQQKLEGTWDREGESSIAESNEIGSEWNSGERGGRKKI